MPTLHESAALKQLDRWMDQPGGAETIFHYSRMLREGTLWSQEYVDAIGQPYMSTRDWSLHQVACFAWVHAAVCRGSIAQIDIGLGHQPAPDREREANSEYLADLPAPFRAFVDPTQKTSQGDGTLEWTEPVIADVSTGTETEEGVLGVRPVSLRPAAVRLEIGTTLPSRTAVHLCEVGAVARWAYGTDSVRVLYWVDTPLTVLAAEAFQNRVPDSGDI